MNYCNYLKNKISEIENFGYILKNVIESSNDYKLGLSYINQKINQKINLTFYDKNPLKNDTNDLAISIKIFKDLNHIDLSRLGSDNPSIGKYCNYQYFIFQNNNIATQIMDEIFLFLFSQHDILFGEKWINIEYDQRDDY